MSSRHCVFQRRMAAPASYERETKLREDNLIRRRVWQQLWVSWLDPLTDENSTQAESPSKATRSGGRPETAERGGKKNGTANSMLSRPEKL